MQGRGYQTFLADRAADHGPGSREWLLAEEANHRIANNLSLIVGFMHMQAAEFRRHPGEIGTAEAARMLDDMGARVQTVAALHRRLSSAPPWAEVDVAAYLREICEGLVQTFSYSGEVDLSGLEPGCIAPAVQAMPLAMIVGELVTNAIKYAHPAGDRGHLAVGARCEDDGTLVVDVSDDGVGLPEGLDPLAEGGTGLRLVRTLGEELRASLEIASGRDGLRVRLHVPPH